MSRPISPYYPPRARWYSHVILLWQSLRRRVWLDRLHLPGGIPLSMFLAGIIIPGMAFIVRKERAVGFAVLVAYVLLTATFFFRLGHPIANFAFGLMLSLHVSSILFLLGAWLAHVRLVLRLTTGFCLLLVVGFGIYVPLRDQLQEKWFIPLRIGENVVVVQTFSSSSSVRRGDWIAYDLRGGGNQGVIVRSGMGLCPVLAVAGDRVRFKTETFEVNGVARPRLPHMPVEGGLVIPEKHWFLWPEFAINNYAPAQLRTVDATILPLATVSESQFVGKPFGRWFWRQQNLQ
ncbi:MAG TPA: hypothetical protein PKA41_03270 [Verrucomicrobiota bacterium]|nr:hypothetical protein [Verrucomicrobiota bacterium]